MSRFVRPELRVLHISNGDTLTVKKRLNAGEERATFKRMYLAGIDGRMHLDPIQMGLALVTSYLVDWTLTDESGAVVPIQMRPLEEVEAALDALEPESFNEIKEAIEQHEVDMKAEREAEKKTTLTGERPSSATSPSPSAAGGALSGSVN